MTRELAIAVAEVAQESTKSPCGLVGNRPNGYAKGERYGVHVPAEGTTYWDYSAVVAAHPDWHAEIQRSSQEKGFEP